MPSLRAASRSSSRASLQGPSPLESPGTSPRSQDAFNFTGRPARASPRQSLQLPSQQRPASMSIELPQQAAAAVPRPALPSPKQSLQLSGVAQQEDVSTGEDGAQDFVIPTARPARSRPADSPRLAAEVESQAATAASVVSRSNSRAESSSQKSNSRKTSFKLDQVLPDPGLHAPSLQSAQLGGTKQKRSMPLIQQPVRPGSPSASKAVQKQGQGFRPQHDWVGFGSRKPQKK